MPARVKYHSARGIVPFAAWTCGALLAGASEAHAYLDPGTGGILLQVILGAIAAGAAALVSLRARIGAAVAGFKTRKDTPTPTKDTPNNQA